MNLGRHTIYYSNIKGRRLRNYWSVCVSAYLDDKLVSSWIFISLCTWHRSSIIPAYIAYRHANYRTYVLLALANWRNFSCIEITYYFYQWGGERGFLDVSGSFLDHRSIVELFSKIHFLVRNSQSYESWYRLDEKNSPVNLSIKKIIHNFYKRKN